MLPLKKSHLLFPIAWLSFSVGFFSIFSSPTLAEEKPQIYVQMGHSRVITSTAISPDGQFALSGSCDGTLKLWEISSGREIRTFAGHPDEVNSVAFSPDGRYALSGSRDTTLKLWEVSTGQEVRSFAGHTHQVSSVAFSPDGRYALSGSRDTTLKLWEISTGREVRTFAGHAKEVLSVAFSPDGRYALSGSWDTTLKLWDISTGREIRTFRGHADCVETVAISSDGRYALSGGYDKIMRLWDIATGTELRTFRGHVSRINSVAFSPDGRYALTGSCEHPSTNKNDNMMKLWDIATGKELRTFEGHLKWISSVAFGPDGRSALSGSYDHTLKLWDIPAGKEVRTIKGFFEVAYSPDGRYVLLESEDRNLLRLWEIATGKELRNFSLGLISGVESLALSPDVRYFLSVSRYGKEMKLTEISTGKEVKTFPVHLEAVNLIVFSPDGRYALSNSRDATLKLWDVFQGREIRTFTGHDRRVNSVAFSPDGKYALSGSDDKTMKLWDISTGREVRTFKGHSDYATAVSFSPDGRYALSGSSNGEVKIWNASTGAEICTFVSFRDGEWIAITPEGYFSASPNGAKYLNVRIGNNVYGVDQFYAKFYRPELLELALAGKELPKGETLDNILARSPAPAVQITSPASGGIVDRENITVSLKITDKGGGIGNVNIYLNGSQVANETRGIVIKGRESANERMLSFTLSLMEGQNEIKAVAFNRENSMESNPAVVSVNSRVMLQKPNLYALVVGINTYKNKSISLTYAVSDAEDFAEALKMAAAPLFEKMDIQLLTTPALTTKEIITQSFEELRTKIKPNDLFVFFNASHGTVDVVNHEEQYFLLTSNVLFLSSRHIGKDALSQTELARLVGSIPAQKKLVILDTCNAGRGGKGIQVALLQQTRGLTESTAVKLLQRAIGSAVFAASSDTQQAFEGYKGHGLFTYVLMEGLQGKADIKKDGYITVLGLADYVETEVTRLSEEIFKRQQTPTIQTGANFPIGKVAR